MLGLVYAVEFLNARHKLQHVFGLKASLDVLSIASDVAVSVHLIPDMCVPAHTAVSVYLISHLHLIWHVSMHLTCHTISSHTCFLTGTPACISSLTPISSHD